MGGEGGGGGGVRAVVARGWLKGERVGGWGGVGMGQPVTHSPASSALRNEAHAVFAKQIGPLTGQYGD